jgi:hypothetical protein
VNRISVVVPQFLNFSKTRFEIFLLLALQKSIKSRRRLTLQCYIDNATLKFAFLHNVFVHRRKVMASKVIVCGPLEPLSHP